MNEKFLDYARARYPMSIDAKLQAAIAACKISNLENLVSSIEELGYIVFMDKQPRQVLLSIPLAPIKEGVNSQSYLVLSLGKYKMYSYSRATKNGGVFTSSKWVRDLPGGFWYAD